MTAGVGRMQRLIRDLLAFCRLTDVSGAPVGDLNMADIVDLACDNLGLLIADTGARIEHGELPVIKFNETQLLQLMQNLIGNALKYRGEAPPRVRISAEREEGGWKLSVSDNGIGLDMRHAGQIFRPFKRLRTGDDSGTGIGLAICKKIVESRGGRIWVESVPGAGSQFSFTIPDAQPLAVAAGR
jgi:light-regulated signal transduction histidine kinase (bacteriophytochrome)